MIGTTKAHFSSYYRMPNGLESVAKHVLTISKQCESCTHKVLPYDPVVGLACAAFPGGIPAPILNGEVDHTQPYEGDNGIRYEKWKPRKPLHWMPPDAE